MCAIISVKILLLICGNSSTFSFIKLLPGSDHSEETQLRHSSWKEGELMLVSSDCHYFEVNIVSFLTHCIINNDIHLEGKEQFYYVDFP